MTGERDFLDGLEELLPHLRRYARALTRDPDGADDLVQDTLERAIARRDRYRPGTSLRSWSFTLMHNLHIDQCRGRQRRGPVLPYDETFDPRVADGEPTEGVFTRFAGEGRFDPAAPEEATLELRIESASIDLGDAKASAFATSAEWFDSANHPQIVYRLHALSRLEGDRYRAEGELTIRGRTRLIVTPIELEIGETEARASGTLRIDRRDYLLGVGPMSLFVDIGREVAVRFELVARPKG